VQPVAVVVPCYNEAARLDGAAFVAFARDHDWLSFVFVDDGSADDTAAVLAALRAQLPERISTVRLEGNAGKAEAVRRGVLEACRREVAAVGYWDADLATPLDAIPAFAALLEAGGCDAVLGSRVKLLGRRIERRGSRHYLGRVFATLASWTLGLAVYDTQCGAKLFRRCERLEKTFAEPFLTRWIFDVEILARWVAASAEGPRGAREHRIVEYPLEAWRHVPGSKLRLRDFVQVPRDLVRLWLHMRASRRAR
jgi:glycosyltransferase involved in cell wall biosynthesis